MCLRYRHITFRMSQTIFTSQSVSRWSLDTRCPMRVPDEDVVIVFRLEWILSDVKNRYFQALSLPTYLLANWERHLSWRQDVPSGQHLLGPISSTAQLGPQVPAARRMQPAPLWIVLHSNWCVGEALGHNAESSVCVRLASVGLWPIFISLSISIKSGFS